MLPLCRDIINHLNCSLIVEIAIFEKKKPMLWKCNPFFLLLLFIEKYQSNQKRNVFLFIYIALEWLYVIGVTSGAAGLCQECIYTIEMGFFFCVFWFEFLLEKGFFFLVDYEESLFRILTLKIWPKGCTALQQQYLMVSNNNLRSYRLLFVWAIAIIQVHLKTKVF